MMEQNFLPSARKGLSYEAKETSNLIPKYNHKEGLE
jgi:hypothetical protein